jgi:hypothetical protein
MAESWRSWDDWSRLLTLSEDAAILGWEKLRPWLLLSKAAWFMSGYGDEEYSMLNAVGFGEAICAGGLIA